MLYNQKGQVLKLQPNQSVPVWAVEKLNPPPHKGHPYFRLDKRARFKVK